MGMCQDDPISAVLLTLGLELLFLINSKPEIEGLAIFDCSYLYSAYAYDTTFFLKLVSAIFYQICISHQMIAP